MQMSQLKQPVNWKTHAPGIYSDCSWTITKGHKKRDTNSKRTTLRTHRVGR